MAKTTRPNLEVTLRLYRALLKRVQQIEAQLKALTKRRAH